MARGLMNIRPKTKDQRQKTMGQSIAEYTVLISVIAAALLAMQIYMKRGIQATIKYSTDQFGNQSEWRETDPDEVTVQETTMQSLSDVETRIQQQVVDGRITATTTMDENSTSSGVSTSWKEED